MAKHVLQGLKAMVMPVALAALAACSSTATQSVSTDSPSGTLTSVRGTVTLGTAVDRDLLGRWTMSDRFARSCTYTFQDQALTGSSSIARAVPGGYCTPPFDDVAGWRSAGRDIVLTDADGDRLVSLSPVGPGAYEGRFRGRTLSIEVRMRKGFV